MADEPVAPAPASAAAPASAPAPAEIVDVPDVDENKVVETYKKLLEEVRAICSVEGMPWVGRGALAYGMADDGGRPRLRGAVSYSLLAVSVCCWFW